MIKYWPLLKKLTLREIKVRYKQSFLGLFWVVLNPFFQMLIMSFVFGNIIGRIADVGIPYPIFLYVGLLPWTFLNFSLTSSMDVFYVNGPLIKKIYFPRQILVLSSLMAKAFDFVLASLIFFGLMLYYGLPFSWFILLLIPIYLLHFVFTYSLALLLASLNLFYRDIQYLFSLVLTLWFYLTPIIYSVEYFPEEYRWIFKINPMSVFINAYRQVLLGGDWPSWSSLGVGALVTGILFIIANVIFHKLQKSFADVV
jgi:lipopolysaccharide transport system permease protein